MSILATIREYVYIGAYTEHHAGRGIVICQWNPAAEALTLIGVEDRCVNPSFLAFHPSGRIAYAANERDDSARITAYNIDPFTGRLASQGGVDVPGAGMCHLAVSPNGRWIAAADYNSGHIVSAALNADGGLTGQVTAIRNEGSGPHPRQEGPHAHQVVFDPVGRLVTVDLGLDRIFSYSGGCALIPAASPHAETPPGEGPRHLLFHPRGHCAWVLTELGNNVLRYAYDVHAGVLTPTQTISLLPKCFEGRAFAAELQLSADTRFLYASVRGDYDRIVRFDAAPDGALSNPVPFPSYGREPRMFSLDSSGRYIFIANQRSDSIAVVHVDPTTGDLSAPCCEISVPQACYVQCRRFSDEASVQ